MPTTLPIPSKGALRTLRHLALGTSCTVAFSAGLLTEDRRRRIHAAREVHDNAKKLKSSRKYHGTGTIAIETFEEQAARYQDDAYWLPSNVARSKRLEASDKVDNSKEIQIQRLEQRPEHSLVDYNTIWRSYRPALALPPMRPRKPISRKRVRQVQQDRQDRLARDVTKLLEEEPMDLDAAILRFFEALEQGLVDEGSELSHCLVDAAVRLSDACKQQSRIEEAERIFDMILGFNALDEDDFHRFEPCAVMLRLLEHLKDQEPLDLTKLKKASLIYLTKFKEKPRPGSEKWQTLGETLYEETCKAELYDLCLQLITRCSVGQPYSSRAMPYLIKATHARGQHKRMFRLFKNMFVNTTPTSIDFFQSTNLVIDSLLKLKDFDKAEEVIVAAVHMAKRLQLSPSTTWFLKLLGHHWRACQDLTATGTLFDRLEPLSSSVNHPQAFYVAMIQCCVEAGDETLAVSFFYKMQSLYVIGPKDLRVYGHLALAKAMRADWPGVKKDLLKMRECNPVDRHTFCSCFTPILKLYSNSHPIEESEEFVRFYVDECQLRLDDKVMNLMANAYLKAKEIDSFVRWISYAFDQGLIMDSMTFNTLLNNLHSTWKLRFPEIMDFYLQIRGTKRPPGDSTSKIKDTSIVIDQETGQILRRLATIDCPDEERKADRLRWLDELTPRSQTLDSEGVHMGMTMTLGKGKPHATLKIYKHAQSRKILLGPEHLVLAVRASLRLHDEGANDTTLLIQDAHRRGLDVSHAVAAVFVEQLTLMCKSGENDPDRISSLAFQTVSLFENTNIKIPASVITHTTTVLHRSGFHKQAIDFWHVMLRRLDLTHASFDIVTFTVLCKCYAAMMDTKGIDWVMDTIVVNDITPDTDFRDMLKEIQRQTLRSLQDRKCSDKVRRFLECILDARQKCKDIRAVYTNVRTDIKYKTQGMVKQAVAEHALKDPCWNFKHGIFDGKPVNVLRIADFEAEEGDYAVPPLDPEDDWLQPRVGSVPDSHVPARVVESAVG